MTRSGSPTALCMRAFVSALVRDVRNNITPFSMEQRKNQRAGGGKIRGSRPDSAIEFVPAEDERDQGRDDNDDRVDDEGETDATRELNGPRLAQEGEGQRGDGAGD